MLSSGAFLLLVTLFNLQGTRCALADSFNRLPHLSFFVKNFFQVFSKFFDAVLFSFCVVFADNSDRIPHLFFFVNTFFRVFSKFLDVSLSFFAFQRSSLADNSDRIPHCLLFVNTFLQIFSKSFCNVVPYSFPSQQLKSPKVLI